MFSALVEIWEFLLGFNKVLSSEAQNTTRIIDYAFCDVFGQFAGRMFLFSSHTDLSIGLNKVS